MRRYALLLVALAACGPHRAWQRPGHPPDPIARADQQAECQTYVDENVGGFGIVKNIIESATFEGCMQRAGYELLPEE